MKIVGIKNFCRLDFCYKLVYYEYFQDINEAIDREKQIKKYRREKKEKLINQFNQGWKFLNDNKF